MCGEDNKLHVQCQPSNTLLFCHLSLPCQRSLGLRPWMLSLYKSISYPGWPTNTANSIKSRNRRVFATPALLTTATSSVLQSSPQREISVPCSRNTTDCDSLSSFNLTPLSTLSAIVPALTPYGCTQLSLHLPVPWIHPHANSCHFSETQIYHSPPQT